MHLFQIADGTPPAAVFDLKMKKKRSWKMEKSNIGWLDGGNTFNPWVGCSKVSAGCMNCYAETSSKKLRVANKLPELWGLGGYRHVTGEETWNKPERWARKAIKANSQKLVFCASWADVFEDHPTAATQRPRLFDLIEKTRCKAPGQPGLHWLLLTKRTSNVLRMLPPTWGDGWFGVWLGTTVESSAEAWRADELRTIPASIRFISYEPAISQLPDNFNLKGLHWLIAGGESGPGFRPDNPDWYRHARDLCQSASVPFFFKQSANHFPGRGTTLDGREWMEWPSCYVR